MTRSPAALLVPAALLLFAAGCSEPALDPAVVAAHRTRLELAEEPEGAQTVLEVRQIMLGETPDEHAEDHDHDGDGKPDHAAEDHDAAVEGEEHAAEEDHDHDGDGAADHSAEEHADADHDHDGDGTADHAAEDHDHAAEGEEHAHDDHDHAHPGEPGSTAVTPVVSELDVVLVGSVGGIANPSDQSHPEFPFAKGQAVFFLADPEAVAEMEEHAHAHADGEECAFCAAHAADAVNMLAVVQFTDDEGKTLPIDARELFELKEKETVVVRGKAKVDPTGMLVVDADGLYVRR